MPQGKWLKKTRIVREIGGKITAFDWGKGDDSCFESVSWGLTVFGQIREVGKEVLRDDQCTAAEEPIDWKTWSFRERARALPKISRLERG